MKREREPERLWMVRFSGLLFMKVVENKKASAPRGKVVIKQVKRKRKGKSRAA